MKIGRRGRKSGGIRILCKSFFEKHLEIIKITEKYAWLKIDKNIFYGMSDDVMLCAIYSQPYKSPYYSEVTWDELEGDIVKLTSNGKPFAIIGDMNKTQAFYSQAGIFLNHQETTAIRKIHAMLDG